MTCDASNKGLGAVLYQEQDGVNRVISFASRTLSEAEKNYNLHSGKLEFLALKWGITERFSDYLKFGPAFILFTDNNSLTYVLTSAKLNATGLRWVTDLADYNFSIKYRPGKANIDADYFSRQPMEISELQKKCTETLDSSSLHAVISNARNLSEGKVMPRNNISVLSLEANRGLPAVKNDVLATKQQHDEIIGPVYKAVQAECRPKKNAWKLLPRDTKILLKSFNKLKITDDVLLRETTKNVQIVLPKEFHSLVFKELHDEMAHLGSEKVLDLAKQRFYWPHMAKDIQYYIQKKCRCIVNKKPNRQDRAPLVPIKATYPFEIVSVDFLKLDKCKGGFEYALVICDHFTRFCQVYATRKKSSKAAANKIFNEFILQFGFPRKIHHDLGGEFNSNLFKELHQLSGIKESNTTPWHPMGDGQVERLNRTICNMLKALPEKEKKDWKSHLPKLAFCYNSTINKSTGFSPFYLMFGRQSVLSIDSIFQTEKNGSYLKEVSHKKFACDWKNSMQQAFHLANNNIKKAADYNKQHYDKRVQGVELELGDQVLVRNMREKGGTGKLKSFWEERIFKVIEKKKDLPVYKVISLADKRDSRVLHRNLMMKCNDLSPDIFKDISIKKKPSVEKKEQSEVHISDDDEADQIEVRLFDEHPVLFEGERGGEEVSPIGNVGNDEDKLQENTLVPEINEDRPEESEEDESFYGFEDEEGEEEDGGIDDQEEHGGSDTEQNGKEETTVYDNERRSSRKKCRSKVFTYSSIGGNPQYE